MINPLKNPERYDKKALKWETKGNLEKAKKNSDKATRLRAQMGTPGIPVTNAAALYAPPVSCTSDTTGPSFLHLPATQSVVCPPLIETHTRPAVIEQTARPEKIVEVQPVVHREIDAPQVRVVEKHMYESVPSTGPALLTKPALIEETVKPTIIEGKSAIINTHA